MNSSIQETVESWLQHSMRGAASLPLYLIHHQPLPVLHFAPTAINPTPVWQPTTRLAPTLLRSQLPLDLRPTAWVAQAGAGIFPYPPVAKTGLDHWCCSDVPRRLLWRLEGSRPLCSLAKIGSGGWGVRGTLVGRAVGGWRVQDTVDRWGDWKGRCPSMCILVNACSFFW